MKLKEFIEKSNNVSAADIDSWTQRGVDVNDASSIERINKRLGFLRAKLRAYIGANPNVADDDIRVSRPIFPEFKMAGELVTTSDGREFAAVASAFRVKQGDAWIVPNTNANAANNNADTPVKDVAETKDVSETKPVADAPSKPAKPALPKTHVRKVSKRDIDKMRALVENVLGEPVNV